MVFHVFQFQPGFQPLECCRCFTTEYLTQWLGNTTPPSGTGVLIWTPSCTGGKWPIFLIFCWPFRDSIQVEIPSGPSLSGHRHRFGIRRVHRFGLRLMHRFGIPEDQHHHPHHHDHHHLHDHQCYKHFLLPSIIHLHLPHVHGDDSVRRRCDSVRSCWCAGARGDRLMV